MDKKLIKNRLRKTVAEASVPGASVTDKVQAKSKSENDKYYKEVEKKMGEYEKDTTKGAKDSIEEPKFNYEGSEKEYHDEMEIMNGQEMLRYDNEPSKRFKERANMSIEGNALMGNSPDYANVVAKGQGGDPDFGKNLIKKIKDSAKKRDAATPALDQFGDDIEEKNVGIKGTKSTTKPSIDSKSVAVESKKETKQPIMETNKMKRLRFKSKFDGVDNALNLIPESYKVDNKIFEITDGNENYRVRWEGDLNEGEAIVLIASDKTLVESDMKHMAHLMGFKSDLGIPTGAERLSENSSFLDLLNKSREILAESEEEGEELISEGTRDAFGLLKEDIDDAAPITADTEVEKKKVVTETSDRKNKEHKEDEYHHSDQPEGAKSGCCGASFVQGDRCSDCGEHADKEGLDENEYGHNGVDPFMNVGKDGSFNESVEDDVISMLNELAGKAHAAGFAETPMGGGFSRPKGKQPQGMGELSPAAYDSAMVAGRTRGDGKGDRVANLAQSQKAKLYAGNMITFSDGLNGTEQAEIETINAAQDTINVITTRDQEGIGLKVVINQNQPSVRDLHGANVQVDRKTAMYLAKIAKDELGFDVRPNSFKQI